MGYPWLINQGSQICFDWHDGILRNPDALGPCFLNKYPGYPEFAKNIMKLHMIQRIQHHSSNSLWPCYSLFVWAIFQMSKIITIVGRGFGRRCSHHCVKPTGMGQNCQKWAQPAAELDLSSNLVYINLLLITKQNLDPHRIPWMVGLGKLLLLGLAKCPQLNKSNHPSTRDGGQQHDLPGVATECWDTFRSADISPRVIQNKLNQSEPQQFSQTWFGLISLDMKLIYLYLQVVTQSWFTIPAQSHFPIFCIPQRHLGKATSAISWKAHREHALIKTPLWLQEHVTA